MIKTLAVHAALSSKSDTLRARIARYETYVAHDKELIARGKNQARRYAARLRNHEAALEYAKQTLAIVEKTQETALNAAARSDAQ